MAILTKEELKTVYGIEVPDAQADAYLLAAEEACLSECGIEQGEVTEYSDGGSHSVALTHYPVISITSVKVAGADVPYRFERRGGRVVLSSPAPHGHDSVCVTYQTGWPSEQIPYAIKRAIAFTVQHMVRLGTAGLLGVVSRTSESGGTEQIEQSALPLAVKSLLSPYRRGGIL